MSRLEDEIGGWDGKSAAVLREVFSRHQPSLATLVAMLSDPKLRTASSWLIKHLVEHSPISQPDAQSILDALDPAADWATILHLVQALDQIELEGLDCADTISVLRETMQHDAPFVRAWSISAFAKIAATHVEFAPEAQGIILQAMLSEEKPSVKARLKRAAKYLDQS